MSSPDIVICLLLLLSAMIGLIRGFVKEVLSLVIWVTAFALALIFSPQLGELLVEHIASASFRMIIAFGAIFVGALIIGAIIQWGLAKLIQGTGLSGFDRLLGFLFGSVRGVVLCIVILIMLQSFARDAIWWKQSLLIPELIAFENDVVGFLAYLGNVATELFTKF
ncbi:MAG: CvpA family protein [Pseudomonadales bacterium]|nr:CvpA family protein [Pseudomonadales bacterium]